MPKSKFRSKNLRRLEEKLAQIRKVKGDETIIHSYLNANQEPLRAAGNYLYQGELEERLNPDAKKLSKEFRALVKEQIEILDTMLKELNRRLANPNKAKLSATNVPQGRSESPNSRGRGDNLIQTAKPLSKGAQAIPPVPPVAPQVTNPPPVANLDRTSSVPPINLAQTTTQGRKLSDEGVAELEGLIRSLKGDTTSPANNPTTPPQATNNSPPISTSAQPASDAEIEALIRSLDTKNTPSASPQPATNNAPPTPTNIQATNNVEEMMPTATNLEPTATPIPGRPSEGLDELDSLLRNLQSASPNTENERAPVSTPATNAESAATSIPEQLSERVPEPRDDLDQLLSDLDAANPNDEKLIENRIAMVNSQLLLANEAIKSAPDWVVKTEELQALYASREKAIAYVNELRDTPPIPSQQLDTSLYLSQLALELEHNTNAAVAKILAAIEDLAMPAEPVAPVAAPVVTPSTPLSTPSTAPTGTPSAPIPPPPPVTSLAGGPAPAVVTPIFSETQIKQLVELNLQFRKLQQDPRALSTQEAQSMGTKIRSVIEDITLPKSPITVQLTNLANNLTGLANNTRPNSTLIDLSISTINKYAPLAALPNNQERILLAQFEQLLHQVTPGQPDNVRDFHDEQLQGLVRDLRENTESYLHVDGHPLTEPLRQLTAAASTVLNADDPIVPDAVKTSALAAIQKVLNDTPLSSAKIAELKNQLLDKLSFNNTARTAGILLEDVNPLLAQIQGSGTGLAANDPVVIACSALRNMLSSHNAGMEFSLAERQTISQYLTNTFNATPAISPVSLTESQREKIAEIDMHFAIAREDAGVPLNRDRVNELATSLLSDPPQGLAENNPARAQLGIAINLLNSNPVLSSTDIQIDHLASNVTAVLKQPSAILTPVQTQRLLARLQNIADLSPQELVGPLASLVGPGGMSASTGPKALYNSLADLRNAINKSPQEETEIQAAKKAVKEAVTDLKDVLKKVEKSFDRYMGLMNYYAKQIEQAGNSQSEIGEVRKMMPDYQIVQKQLQIYLDFHPKFKPPVNEKYAAQAVAIQERLEIAQQLKEKYNDLVSPSAIASHNEERVIFHIGKTPGVTKENLVEKTKEQIGTYLGLAPGTTPQSGGGVQMHTSLTATEKFDARVSCSCTSVGHTKMVTCQSTKGGIPTSEFYFNNDYKPSRTVGFLYSLPDDRSLQWAQKQLKDFTANVTPEQRRKGLDIMGNISKDRAEALMLVCMAEKPPIVTYNKSGHNIEISARQIAHVGEQLRKLEAETLPKNAAHTMLTHKQAEKAQANVQQAETKITTGRSRSP